jgi:hypothetical protein
MGPGPISALLSSGKTLAVVEDLAFVDFDEPEPERGVVLELQMRNPDYEAELAQDREARERNPFAESFAEETCEPGLGEPAENLIGADEVCVRATRVTLVVGYPFRGQYAVEVTAADGRFTRAELFRQIVRVHAAMYEDASFGPAALRFNTRVESPRFGTAWHRLEELVVEQVVLQERDGRVLAWIFLGS